MKFHILERGVGTEFYTNSTEIASQRRLHDRAAAENLKHRSTEVAAARRKSTACPCRVSSRFTLGARRRSNYSRDNVLRTLSNNS